MSSYLRPIDCSLNVNKWQEHRVISYRSSERKTTMRLKMKYKFPAENFHHTHDSQQQLRPTVVCAVEDDDDLIFNAIRRRRDEKSH